ncbi:MAG: XdhC family protein [Planctomycetes bacterium]|nr:XdhC family protein [Planctomycetota bacterium]
MLRHVENLFRRQHRATDFAADRSRKRFWDGFYSYNTMNDIEIYKKAAEILEKRQNIALVTAISAIGSTPGRVGYKMLVWGKNTDTLGTIGGGSAEAAIIQTAGDILPKIQSTVLKFEYDGTENDQKGWCGGSIEFHLETFDQKSLPLFKELSTVIEKGDKGILVSIISGNKPPNKILLKNIEQLDSATDINLTPETMESVKKLISRQQPARQTLGNGVEIFIETISEQPMIFLFGAGHLSYYISRYAKSLNFRLTVCDDRAEFANKERFPEADNIIVENFDSVFDRIKINKNSYIVIVTKGHKDDQIVLEKAVRTDAKYIGMIGSKRKTLMLLKKLKEGGIPAEILTRIYSPIGISIGAFTPQEIALSIVSELVKIRRLGDTPESGHMTLTFPNN